MGCRLKEQALCPTAKQKHSVALNMLTLSEIALSRYLVDADAYCKSKPCAAFATSPSEHTHLKEVCLRWRAHSKEFVGLCNGRAHSSVQEEALHNTREEHWGPS
eukprot:1147286-Pelagomonas_calceolata.AAC.3